MRKTLAFALFMGILFLTPSRGALIPPFFLSSVVAIGTHQLQQEVGGVSQHWFTEGTGFFYGYLVHDDKDPTKKIYMTYLVTAAHVIRGHAKSCQQVSIEERLRCQSNTLIRLDAAKATDPAREFQIPISSWFYSSDPSVDLAAVPIPMPWIKDNGFQSSFFSSDDHAATKAQLQAIGASEGDGVFILGFPMNLAGEQKNYVIARQGAIARVSELLEGASKTFMVNSFVFPGNSGGPVVLRPEIVAIDGTKANAKALLIGVVLSYQPYVDVAVSGPTKQPRVVFEENSGLANILPIDNVNDLLSANAKAAWDKASAASAPSSAPAPTQAPAPAPQ